MAQIYREGLDKQTHKILSNFVETKTLINNLKFEKERNNMTLPTDKKERKNTPIYSGVLMYFPKALAEVAKLSFMANEQHNPGTVMHWDRTKSTDDLDALVRHLMEAGTIDIDGARHSTKVAWRALANLEKELENE